MSSYGSIEVSLSIRLNKKLKKKRRNHFCPSVFGFFRLFSPFSFLGSFSLSSDISKAKMHVKMRKAMYKLSKGKKCTIHYIEVESFFLSFCNPHNG